MCMDQCEDCPCFKPQTVASFSYTAHSDSDLSDELRASAQKLGPFAAASLAVFVDLGLSDEEIGQYFGLPNSRISQLLRAWQIAACH
jgi:hypothetical protein